MDEPRMDLILQVSVGFWASKVLLSAVEMELFTELAKHPEGLEPRRGRLGFDPRSSASSLMPSWPWASSSAATIFLANTPPADFLDKRKPSYVGGVLEMANQRLSGSRVHSDTNQIRLRHFLAGSFFCIPACSALFFP